MPTVLVVDDEASILQLIKMTLERAGYEVMTASSAFAALELLRNQVPDIIVSDLAMPSMNGLSFLQVVREEMKITHVPFVFLSSHAEIQHIRAGLGSGADDYLAKPFDRQELLDAIELRLKRVQEFKASPEPSVLMQIFALNKSVVLYQKEVVTWASRKACELFYFLLEKGQVSSWEAAEALWPEKDEERASSLFHTTLHRLRKSLYPEVIATNNRRYFIDPKLSLEYDVRNYTQLAQKALSNAQNFDLLQQAVNTYGTFLPDFDSDWCSDRRAELMETQLRLLLSLAEGYEQGTQLRLAANAYQQTVQLDPLQDSAWDGLARTLTSLRDPHAPRAAKREPWWATSDF